MDGLQFFQEIRFEAARALPKSQDQESRLHGHGFRGIVQHPDVSLQAFHYQSLNDRFTHPTDLFLLDALCGGSPAALSSQWDRGVYRTLEGAYYAHRTFRFESAHRLPHVPPGHKCGRLHGHGFKAVIHAPVLDLACPTHQDYQRIERAWAPIGKRLDRALLNAIPELENPTSEWLAVWIWKALKPALSDLSWVTVFETDSCGAHYDGQSHRIWKDFSLDSAVNESGTILGHTWRLRLHVQGPLHPVFGWTLDFADMKRDFEPLFLSLDHQPLHESAVMVSSDLAGIAGFIRTHGPLVLPQLERVEVFESSGRGVSLDWGHSGIQVLP